MCAVRWAVRTRRWTWTRRACCQIAWVGNDPPPSVDRNLEADALILKQALPHRHPLHQSSWTEVKTPRTGLLQHKHTNSRHSVKYRYTYEELPRELLSLFYIQPLPLVCTWERVICVARKPTTLESERSGRNIQPEPLGGASEQSHNGTRPKRYRNYQTKLMKMFFWCGKWLLTFLLSMLQKRSSP